MFCGFRVIRCQNFIAGNEPRAGWMEITDGDWKDTAQSLAAAFVCQVDGHSNRTAVESESGRLTYGELNRAANGIANALLHARGSSSEPVALLLEHGLPAIIAVLGTLKAGKI